MSYSYIFPNDEDQWDIVGTGSSSEDPFPSLVFSALKHNKTKPILCGANSSKLHMIELSFNKECNIFLQDNDHKFAATNTVTKSFKGEPLDFEKECWSYTNGDIGEFYSPIFIPHQIPGTELPITSSNCYVGNNINAVFDRMANDQKSCTQYKSWQSTGVVEAKYCASNNITSSFHHGHTPPSEWFFRIKSILIDTVFAGCRSENIGLKTLQDEFGTNYVIVITCKYLPIQVSRIPSMVCSPDISSSYNRISGMTTTFECRSYELTNKVSRICNLFINATVPLIEYGRINSMVMMPVFRDYGRMSG